MSETWSRYKAFEEQFLQMFRARAEKLARGGLPVDQAVFESTGEGMDELRGVLQRLERPERDLLERLPGTLAMQGRFLKSRLGGLFRQVVSRVRVRVLSPTDALVSGQPPGPVGREQVLDALARYRLMMSSQRPTGVVFASATGFTPEARSLVDGYGPPTLVLVGQREDGGWDVAMPAPLRKTAWAKLFEFETADARVARLLAHLERDLLALESSGIAIADLARDMGLSVEQTEFLVRQACRARPSLMTVRHDGTLHVCRSPLAEERSSMSLWSRVRRWLRLKPTVAERVRQLTAQRVQIEQARRVVDSQIDKLEIDERGALQAGAQARSEAEQKQYASKLMRVRTELKRARAQAQMHTHQIEVIGTHIHHMTLAEQGRRVALPKAEDLTREAAQAEQAMAELAANAELAGSIEVGAMTPAMQEEEAAILEEFRQMAAGPAAAPSASGQRAAEPPQRAGDGPQREGSAARSAPPLPSRAPEANKSAAKPELG